jgi:hypothetical protein
MARRSSLVEYTSWKEAAEAAVAASRERVGTSDSSSDDGSILTSSSNSTSSGRPSHAEQPAAQVAPVARARRASVANVPTELLQLQRKGLPDPKRSEMRRGSVNGAAPTSGPPFLASPVHARRTRRASVCGDAMHETMPRATSPSRVATPTALTAVGAGRPVLACGDSALLGRAPAQARAPVRQDGPADGASADSALRLALQSQVRVPVGRPHARCDLFEPLSSPPEWCPSPLAGPTFTVFVELPYGHVLCAWSVRCRPADARCAAWRLQLAETQKELSSVKEQLASLERKHEQDGAKSAQTA